MPYTDITYEKLSDKIFAAVSSEHRFGTDAFLLADFAAPRHKDRVIDLCAGTGIVSLLMLRDFAPQSVKAVEIQGKAYDLMVLSRSRSGLLNFEPVLGDLKTFREPVPADVITCNPPYYAEGTGKKSADSSLAAAKHELLCDISDVCRSAKKNLKFGGRLCICNRPERLADCVFAMRENGIEPKRLRTVHKTAKDPAWLILLEGRSGGSGFMRIERPLTVYENGEYSEEMKRIYRISE